MLGYLRTFLPWIAFAVISTPHDSRYGALVGAVLAAALMTAERRRGKPWDALIIEATSVVFFGALAVAAFTAAKAPLGAYGPAVSDEWLALVAWGSLAVRHPFTLGIARTMTPPEMHDNPLFYRVNAVITAVWATAFTVTGAVLALLAHAAPHATAAVIIVKVAAFVLPALFTLRYPKAVAARHQALAR
ncbi:hypothetical protein [Actinoallomurus soli]|uniref:hypothetical protein n=1 Tax=Actinoallomurus soli TaxID=2952535 RepID=UPI00209251FC|nr:hypothetical protein [Actinoallomurus soli]MCO5971870.1 hypothetical protein [Actinoallomurus soli]